MAGKVLATVLAVALIATCFATEVVNMKKIKTACRKQGPCPGYQWEAAKCRYEQDTECAHITKIANAFEDASEGFANCCPTYKCEAFSPLDPCCGVECSAPTTEAANEDCNTIRENLPIWNNLSVQEGARYAYLVESKDVDEGKCCDMYSCRTDWSKYCDNKRSQEPCLNQQSCPVCHTYTMTTPANEPLGKCCPDFTCIKDATCMCEKGLEENLNKTGAVCPMPECSELEYAVKLSEATDENCCASWACQRNMTAICLAKQEVATWTIDGSDYGESSQINLTGWNESTAATLCGPCHEVVKSKDADFESGQCFPTFECKHVANKCCESDKKYGVGVATSEKKGNMPCAMFAQQNLTDSSECGICENIEITRPRNPFNGRCCDEKKCVMNMTCHCGRVQCDYLNAADFQSYNCPLRTGAGGVVLPNVKQWYQIKTRPEDFSKGRCCPKYSCVATPAKIVKDARKAKRKAKRAAKAAKKAALAAAKSSTTKPMR